MSNKGLNNGVQSADRLLTIILRVSLACSPFLHPYFSSASLRQTFFTTLSPTLATLLTLTTFLPFCLLYPSVFSTIVE